MACRSRRPRSRAPGSPRAAGAYVDPARRDGRAPTSAPARPPSKVTEQSAFRPHIVRILKAEGSLETEDMLLELEMAMEDELRERDRQPTPTGEVRWHPAARIERKAMIDAGPDGRRQAGGLGADRRGARGRLLRAHQSRPRPGW